MACKHACGSKAGYARGGSLWNRAFAKGACSRPSCSTSSFAAIKNMAYTLFKADKDIMDALVHPRKKKGAGGRGVATAGEPVLGTPLWGMLYTDAAEVVSQSPAQPRKIMTVIAVVCAAFGLTALEASKTEIM